MASCAPVAGLTSSSQVANILRCTNRSAQYLNVINPTSWLNLDSIYKKRPIVYGEVVRACIPKTIKVKVPESFIHERAQKVQIVGRFVHAHDAKEEAVVGDWVELKPGARRGKYKRSILSRIVIPAKRFTDSDGSNLSQASPEVKLLIARYRKDFINCLYGLETPREYTNIPLDVHRAKINNQYQK